MSAVGVSVGEGIGPGMSPSFRLLLLFCRFSRFQLVLRYINPIAGSQTPTQSGPGQVGSIGLERAFKLLQPLTMLPSPQCEGNVEVWIAFYDVTARRGE